jgi:phage baseplate assembly protein W
MAAIYKGFSFKAWQRNKSFVLTDVDLVKQDLLNHIWTRKGERVNYRNYGTSVQDLLFEPFDEGTIVLMNDEIRGVISFDPRVVLASDADYKVVTDFDNKIMQVSALLFFVELDLTDVLDINLSFQS